MLTISRQALAPTVDVAIVIPSVLPEILLLAQDPNQNSPSLLANALWYKYRTSANWAWKVWDNTIASLRQLPVMAADPSDRLTCARRYVAFLAHVDMHLVDGFNAQVLDWFVGPGKNEVAALNEEVWELVVLLVVKLCATGVLAISTVLRGLVYPTWRAATLASSEAQASSIVVVLRSVTSVFKALLSDEYEHDTASTTTVELYRLRCHRAEVFRAPYFVELLCETYSLVIIEGSPLFSDDVQQASGRLWRATYGSAQFQQALYRDFDGIREVLKRSTAQSAAQGAGDAMDVDVGLVPLVFEAALQTCINSSILRGSQLHLLHSHTRGSLQTLQTPGRMTQAQSHGCLPSGDWLCSWQLHKQVAAFPMVMRSLRTCSIRFYPSSSILVSRRKKSRL